MGGRYDWEAYPQIGRGSNEFTKKSGRIHAAGARSLAKYELSSRAGMGLAARVLSFPARSGQGASSIRLRAVVRSCRHPSQLESIQRIRCSLLLSA
jgi:hypothetical protein